MTTLTERGAASVEVGAKVAKLLNHRLGRAGERLHERVRESFEREHKEAAARLVTPWDLWKQWFDYSVDFAQRSVLYWDTLRQRGNNYVEHNRAGNPPVLHFEYETVLDARTFERPVNYVLLRITPPDGVVVDNHRRPYVIIDPRAGHGPGIGGFKDDSQVGVALKAGHPVYFVSFFPEPEPGQTLLDVCAAEARFVREVRRLHPESPRPAIVGNCQGGWAAMMLAAANPDDTGPIVINGAPMSYWGGAWQDGEGNNPMRYAGGLLGGSWAASLAADLGNGVFDGAHLVQNFENLNPANTFWDKYYNLFANVDSEPARFLEFERWWGGFFLLNREEIEWITQNLFVGNRLWSADGQAAPQGAFDLKAIKSPIVLFASLGDNITPPQQAFNWVADIYGSTEEIKARGQTIVGLVHADIGHLGIFVSGRVAKKEHAQIVSVLKSIESLPPGLWGMKISDRPGAEGQPQYDVEFTEHRLEDVAARLNRFERADERPFAAAARVAVLNQELYETFARPLVQMMSNDSTADLNRRLHPLRFTRWAVSDLNPLVWWLAPAAEAVRSARRAVSQDQPLRRAERLMSDMLSASFDYYRDVRDAASEAAFFQMYGGMLSLAPAVEARAAAAAPPTVDDPRTLPVVQAALEAIDKGGYNEAVARAGFMLRRGDEPLPLDRLHMRREVAAEYRDLMPAVEVDEWRRLRGTQEIMVRYEPDRAMETLPRLLARSDDRRRFLDLLERILNDKRVQADKATPQQLSTLARIREVLGAAAPAARTAKSK
jgi:pimeloyl-ACP methyl ester carboxylesterase